MRRARNRCECAGCVLHAGPCNAPATDVDHIHPGDNHDLTNLRAICRPCHSYKSGREGRAARRPD